ncbi:MAG: hypothetical protein KF908_10720 [Nitrosomonas sp.]|nr:hypothetical protein [Nitrosomonas sp.]MCW5607490.1 hypothetical protein [Nitrosomonas sp.]
MKRFVCPEGSIARHCGHLVLSVIGLWLMLLTTSVQANCEGCLCPGDPCRLCPLPAIENDTMSADESEICARIRARVPPTSAQPGANEYFPSLDQSIAACVGEGGDVIRNRQRSEEFPSRFYCKPPTPVVNR